jgi:hypothetical protein
MNDSTMTLSRRGLLLAVACAPFGAAAADEAGLREAMQRYARAWNERDIAAWKSLVTDDLHYQESYLHTDEARQMTTRDRSLRAFESAITGFDFEWKPLKIHFRSDGSATAVMHVVQRALPKTNGKYTAIFETNPAIARWRLVNGRWQMYHYVTYAPYAKQLVATEKLLP